MIEAGFNYASVNQSPDCTLVHVTGNETLASLVSPAAKFVCNAKFYDITTQQFRNQEKH